MYHDYYGLQADPFRLSPDHSFCLRHASFAKAKAYMQYALHRAEGFVMITGTPGTGKTTLIDDLLAGTGDTEFSVARLVSAQLSAEDVLRLVAYAFSIPADGLKKSELLNCLSKEFFRLSRLGRRPLLIVDEAQGLDRQALEELRLLTNLTQEGKPLLQIFLVGQEQLTHSVTSAGLEQLIQRIVASCHMEGLEPEEFVAYVRHRLSVAGWRGQPTFSPGMFPELYRCSQGIPRRINHICSRLLLHGALEGKSRLEKQDLDIVISELRQEHYLTRVRPSVYEIERFDADDLRFLSAYQVEEPVTSVQSATAPQEAVAATAQEPDIPDPSAAEEQAAPPAQESEPPQLGADQIVKPGTDGAEPTTASTTDHSDEGVVADTAGDGKTGDKSPKDPQDRSYTAPLWGSAGAAGLCLLVMLLVLISIPEYQVRRLASHAVWDNLGISTVRAGISTMTAGKWPIDLGVGRVVAPIDATATLIAMESADNKGIGSNRVAGQSAIMVFERPAPTSASGIK